MYKSKFIEDKIGKLHHLGLKTHKMLNPFNDLKKTVAKSMHETRLLKHKSKTLRGSCALYTVNIYFHAFVGKRFIFNMFYFGERLAYMFME